MFFRLLLVLAVFAALMYYVFVFLHETGIVKWIKRPVSLGKAMIPFYYLFHWEEKLVEESKVEVPDTQVVTTPEVEPTLEPDPVIAAVKTTKPRAPRKTATKKTVAN